MSSDNSELTPVEKAKDFKGTLKKLLQYIGKYKIALFFVVIVAIGGTLFTIVGPRIVGKVTTELFNGLSSKYSGGPGIDFLKIGKIIIFLLSLYFVSTIFSIIQGYIMSGISKNISYRLRKEMAEKISRIPLSYFESKTHGEVLSRITNDVDTLGTSLNQSITQLIQSAITLVGIAVMMISISPRLTLISIGILPMSVAFMAFIIEKSQKYFKQQQEYLGHINGQVEEVFSGHNIVAVFNREKSVVDEFQKKNDMIFESEWKSQFLSGLMMPIMTFVGNLGYVAVAVTGVRLAIGGTIQVGDIQSFIIYVKQFTQPIIELSQVSNMFQSMAASAERVFEFLEEKEEIQIAENHAPIKAGDVYGNVSFEHVNFGYTQDKLIIHDFTAYIKKGQKIAIVGPTGAGKTTMVKLLMGFYDTNSGAIKLDNYNIKDFDRRELRECFGMVLQETWLFKGTIMENIRYGKITSSDEEVITAAKAAHAHHFIKTLPEGYGMEINEEASNISEGQKQLLTIARTILANNPVLILDEATSSVDTRTEVLIQKAMDHLMKGCTSFIIAHRLSTIKNADLILVMKDGDIVEQGKHEDLIRENGYYTDLYNSQFEKVLPL